MSVFEFKKNVKNIWIYGIIDFPYKSPIEMQNMNFMASDYVPTYLDFILSMSIINIKNVININLWKEGRRGTLIYLGIR